MLRSSNLLETKDLVIISRTLSLERKIKASRFPAVLMMTIQKEDAGSFLPV